MSPYHHVADKDALLGAMAARARSLRAAHPGSSVGAGHDPVTAHPGSALLCHRDAVLANLTGNGFPCGSPATPSQ